MSADRLRIIRNVAPEVFRGAGPHGGLLSAPEPIVVPVALEGGVLTVLTFPPGTAAKIDQNALAYKEALAQRGAQVDYLETIDVSRAEIFLANGIVEVEARVAKLEGPA